MNIVIDNYRIRRYDSLNLCVEVYKQVGKSKNPYGRNGKPKDGEIAQKNESNKPKYKWDLVAYSHNLDYCLKCLVEHCLTNNEDINSIQKLQTKINELHEKITEISEANNRSIEENILSNNDFDQERANKLADEALY